MVLAVLAALNHFLVRSPAVPAEYAGIWVSGPDDLTYRVRYVPRRLRPDSAPHPRDDV